MVAGPLTFIFIPAILDGKNKGFGGNMSKVYSSGRQQKAISNEPSAISNQKFLVADVSPETGRDLVTIFFYDKSFVLIFS